METKVIRIEIKFTRTTLALLLGSVLLLAGLMVVGGVLAQDSGPETEFPPLPPGMEMMTADEAAALETMAVADNVASTISYQGRLTDSDGNPLSGDYNMSFQLLDAETGGNPVGSAINKTGVEVTDGLFNVELNVASVYFTGQALWLEVTVGGETLDPPQQILPAPYALSLRPGAIISDTGSYVKFNRYTTVGPLSAKTGVYAKTDGGGIFQYGLYGDGGFVGVYGYSENSYGVYASTGVSGTAALYAYGNAMQSLDGNGMIKAAVHANCSSASSEIHRSFNGVGLNEITIANGASSGECTIDFGFDISERFWVTTGEYHQPRIVNCRINSSDNNQLECFRFNEAGAGATGDIMVLLY